jgi:P2 family phage contractile tail tube protein
MALPRKLKNLNVFMDGVTWIGEVSGVTLPKLARKLEDYRGGGMNGPIGVDMGLDETIKMDVTTGGWIRQAAQSMGAATHDAVQLRFAGAYQRDDTGEVDAIEITVRGRFQEIDRGDSKPGDDTEVKHTIVCSYYRETYNGVEDVLIDLPNMVEVYGGVDRLAEQRAAIGA